MKKDYSYKDFAIVLTWPDATIRGDEKWMMFFKKIGIVKNLNFKVGHTGVVIISHKTGEMLYYDFGRYIAPRGYGRARSKFSDPLLHLDQKADIKNNKITNLLQVAEAFEEIKPYTYGEGELYFSVVEGINFDLAKKYGDECVDEGTYSYGAVARKSNNCSRFITRMFMKSSERFHYWHGINLPETIKSSPISNVVNGVKDRMIYSYSPEKGLKNFRMNRWQSFFFLIKKLGDNVYSDRSKHIREDETIGWVEFKSKPITVPKNAQYLGGVGDGAWYEITKENDHTVRISRYTSEGKFEYTVIGEPEKKIDWSKPVEIAYDSHLLFSTLTNGSDEKIKISHIKGEAASVQQEEIRETLYA